MVLDEPDTGLGENKIIFKNDFVVIAVLNVLKL